MSEPSARGHDDVPDETLDDRRADQDRDVSRVGLAHPGNQARTDEAGAALGEPDVDVDGGPAADDGALDDLFPPESSLR